MFWRSFTKQTNSRIECLKYLQKNEHRLLLRCLLSSWKSSLTSFLCDNFKYTDLMSDCQFCIWQFMQFIYWKPITIADVVKPSKQTKMTSTWYLHWSLFKWENMNERLFCDSSLDLFKNCVHGTIDFATLDR